MNPRNSGKPALIRLVRKLPGLIPDRDVQLRVTLSNYHPITITLEHACSTEKQFYTYYRFIIKLAKSTECHFYH